MDFFGLTFIMFTGAAIILLGYLVMLFTAFTTSAAWGIGSLLLPPVVIAFAVSHWGKAKKGFALLAVGAIIFAYGSWDKTQTEKRAQQEAASVRPDLLPVTPSADTPGADSAPVGQNSTAAPSAPSADVTATASDKPPVINLLDVKKYLNREVRITLVNGQMRTGTLLEANDEGIVIDYMPMGVDTRVRTQIAEDQIQLIELLQ